MCISPGIAPGELLSGNILTEVCISPGPVQDLHIVPRAPRTTDTHTEQVYE